MIGLILMGASMAMSAYSAASEGAAGENTAEYNEAVARQKAELARKTMEAETIRMATRARAVKAGQRAGYQASGAATTGGTPLLVLAEEAGNVQMDILNKRVQRLRETQGFQGEAAMQGLQAKQYRKGALVSVAGTILGGASTMSEMLGSKSTGRKTSGMSISRGDGNNSTVIEEW